MQRLHIDELTAVAKRVRDRSQADRILRSALDQLRTLERLEDLERQRQEERSLPVMPSGAPITDPILTTEMVEFELDIGHTHLNDLLRAGVIRAKKIGKRNLFRRSEVDRFIAIPDQQRNRMLKAHREKKEGKHLRMVKG